MEPKFTCGELKRLAQAIVHFEPAVEALVPADRRGNKYVKSNWLDNPSFGHVLKTRAEATALIENVNNIDELVQLMEQRFDSNYAWSFETVRDVSRPTIEFRKPPVSRTPEQALSWAEFVISFVKASLRTPSVERLGEVPPTLGGLRWFLKKGRIVGVSEPRRLDRLFRGKDDDSTLAPIPRTENFFDSVAIREVWRERLVKKAAEDHEEIVEFAKGVNPPYRRERVSERGSVP